MDIVKSEDDCKVLDDFVAKLHVKAHSPERKSVDVVVDLNYLGENMLQARYKEPCEIFRITIRYTDKVVGDDRQFVVYTVTAGGTFENERDALDSGISILADVQQRLKDYKDKDGNCHPVTSNLNGSVLTVLAASYAPGNDKDNK